MYKRLTCTNVGSGSRRNSLKKPLEWDTAMKP